MKSIRQNTTEDVDRPQPSQPTSVISEHYKSVQDIVFNMVKEEILSGTYPPGAQLNTLKLAERFGVSRTPVREALNRLAEVGLVTGERHRGMFVRNLSMDDVVSIYCIRAALSGVSAKLAAKRITDDELRKLSQLCDETETHLHEGNHEEMLSKNAEFHFIISRASGSSELDSLIEQYYHRSAQYRALSMELSGRDDEVCKEHRQILQALKDGDADQAEFYAREHYFATARKIAKSIGMELPI